jgi:hypothetical protein
MKRYGEVVMVMVMIMWMIVMMVVDDSDRVSCMNAVS